MNVGPYSAGMWASATAWDMALGNSNDSAEAAATPTSDGDSKGAAAAAAPRVRFDLRDLAGSVRVWAAGAADDVDVSRVVVDSQSIDTARDRILFDFEEPSFLRPPQGIHERRRGEFSAAEVLAANTSVVDRHCMGVMHHCMQHFGWMGGGSENEERLEPYKPAGEIARLIMSFSGDMERVEACAPSVVNLQIFPLEKTEISFRALILLATKFARSCSKEDFDKMHDLFTDLRLQLPPEVLTSMKMEIDYVMRRCAMIADSFVDGISPLKLDCYGLCVWLASRVQKKPNLVAGGQQVSAYTVAYQIIGVGFFSSENEMDSTILEAHIRSHGLDVNAVFKKGTSSLLQLAFTNVSRTFSIRTQGTNRQFQNAYKALEVVLRAGGDINSLGRARVDFWNVGLFAHPQLFKLLVEYGMDLNADAIPALAAITDPNIFASASEFDTNVNEDNPVDLIAVRKRAVALCSLHRMQVTDAVMLAIESPQDMKEAAQNLAGQMWEEWKPLYLFGPSGFWTESQAHLIASEAAYCTGLVEKLQTPSSAETKPGPKLFNLVPILQIIANYALDLKAISPDYFRRFTFTQKI